MYVCNVCMYLQCMFICVYVYSICVCMYVCMYVFIIYFVYSPIVFPIDQHG